MSIGLEPIQFAWNTLFRDTEVFEVESQAAGLTYVVFVATPPGYDADADRAYPVIFMPDANGSVSLTIPSVTAATTSDHSGRNLHMTVCDKEITEPTMCQLLSTQWTRLLADLSANSLPGLRLTSHSVPGETRISGKAGTWYNFLRTCFPAKRPAEVTS